MEEFDREKAKADLTDESGRLDWTVFGQLWNEQRERLPAVPGTTHFVELMEVAAEIENVSPGLIRAFLLNLISTEIDEVK